MDPLGEADGSSALNKQFGEFRDRISKEAGRVVHEKWPAKIMELNECLKVRFLTSGRRFITTSAYRHEECSGIHNHCSQAVVPETLGD